MSGVRQKIQRFWNIAFTEKLKGAMKPERAFGFLLEKCQFRDQLKAELEKAFDVDFTGLTIEVTSCKTEMIVKGNEIGDSLERGILQDFVAINMA